MLKILFIGDIVGKIGRRTVTKLLPAIIEKQRPDLVIANGENLAHGVGFTNSTIAEMEACGINFFTSGNHAWSKNGSEQLLQEKNNIIRPANYRARMPGHGYAEFSTSQGKVLIINLLGRVFMLKEIDYLCPFKGLEKILRETKEAYAAIIVDFHAEATSEKRSFGFFADGKVSAVLGTHTHVPTADQQVLPQGTAYVTDVGMVGGQDTVIGANKKVIINRFLAEELTGGEKNMHEVPAEGPAIFNAVLISVDPKTRLTKKIERLDILTEIS